MARWLRRVPGLSACRSLAFVEGQRRLSLIIAVIAGLQASPTCAQTAPIEAGAGNGQTYVKQAGPYLDFIRDHLWQQIGSGPLQGVRALAETEKPLAGDVWFWTDDNAKALEAYLVPEAYSRYQDIADSLLSFVRRMSEGPIIRRRIATPALTVKSENPHNFRIDTGLMTFHGNLHRDEVDISYRFHDGRDVDAMKLSGNSIRFDLDGHMYQFDVKDSIISARVTRRDGLVTLEHISEFVVSGFTPVARATYSYTIDPALTRLLIDISVEALNSARLRNVQITSAMDHLSDLQREVSYQRFCGMRGADLSCQNVTTEARISLAKGGLDWYSLIQLGNLGFSYAIHTQIMAPDRLVEVTAEGSQINRFHRVYSVYEMGDIEKTSSGRIREAKLLTSGGLYRSMEAYGDLIRNSGNSPGIDFSASYDYGAELNAIGCYYMFASSGRYEPTRRRDDPGVVALRDWFDHHLSMFEQNFLFEQNDRENPFPYLFGRGTAFAILATDCMYRATGIDRYLASMKRMVDIVLRLQRREGRREFDGIFRCCGTSSDLDSQAAMILSLARAALLLDDQRLGPAIVDGINAIRMNRWQALEDRPVVARGDDEIFIPVDPNRPGGRDGILWGFKAGLLLRGLRAAEFAADSGTIAIDNHTRWHIQRLREAATDYINTSTIPRGRSLEILTSYRSGETNSESQPWMLLGLAPIDPIVAQVQPQGEAVILPRRTQLDRHEGVAVRFASGGKTTENELVFSTVPTELNPGAYRLKLNFDSNVCLDNGISPIVLNLLYHREASILKIEPVEPASQADCENGFLEFDFRNQSLGLVELNLYARRVLSLPHAPMIKYLERIN